MDRKEKWYLCNIIFGITLIIVWVIEFKTNMICGYFASDNGIAFAIIYYSFGVLVCFGTMLNHYKFINYKKEKK